jgi:hypothetical protein
MLRRSTLIVLIVFLVLVGVVLYLQYAEGNQDAVDSTANADFSDGGDAASDLNATVQAYEELLDFDPNAVTGLRVEAADGRTVVIKKDEDGAFVLAAPETPAEMTDAVRIFDALDTLSRLEVAFDLDPQLELDVLGLDDAGYEVILFLEGDEQIDFLVGAETPPKTGYYVQVAGDTPKAVGKLAVDNLLAFFDDPPVVPTPTLEPQETE